MFRGIQPQAVLELISAKYLKQAAPWNLHIINPVMVYIIGVLLKKKQVLKKHFVKLNKLMMMVSFIRSSILCRLLMMKDISMRLVMQQLWLFRAWHRLLIITR